MPDRHAPTFAAIRADIPQGLKYADGCEDCLGYAVTALSTIAEAMGKTPDDAALLLIDAAAVVVGEHLKHGAEVAATEAAIASTATHGGGNG